MPAAWLLVKTRHLATALSGEGSSLHGGRWNSRGVRAVYASESLALAALEILVRLRFASGRVAYSSLRISFDDSQVIRLDEASLPAKWRESPVPHAAQAIGDRWVRQAASLALRVPSVIVPREGNYVINPLHREMPSLAVGPAEPFEFDPRLLPGGPVSSSS